MERTIEVKLISAEDLRFVNHIRRMKVYGEVCLSSDQADRRRSAPDEHNEERPRWKGATFTFKIPDGEKLESIFLYVQLRTRRFLGIAEDRDVGEVVVPVKDLEAGVTHSVRYQVTCPKGTTKGIINFAYRLS